MFSANHPWANLPQDPGDNYSVLIRRDHNSSRQIKDLCQPSYLFFLSKQAEEGKFRRGKKEAGKDFSLTPDIVLGRRDVSFEI